MKGMPKGCVVDHLLYLDELRASGATNMFGARPFLIEEFNLDQKLAEEILSYWMSTFSERHKTVKA